VKGKQPTTILVGVQRYTVKYSKSLEDFGDFDMSTGEIRVQAGLPPVSKASTLLHEILHAVADTLGGGLTEGQVRCVEQGLSMAIQDNPKLFRGIIRDLQIPK